MLRERRESLARLTAALIGVGGNVAPIQAASNPATPIQHLVVVFQENVSFDHYFGTYPNAANLLGENVFQAKPSTPTINGLSIALLQHNPNLNPLNGAGATNPFRLSPSQAVTADQDHDYDAEQKAFHGGAMDLVPLQVGTPGPPPNGILACRLVQMPPAGSGDLRRPFVHKRPDALEIFLWLSLRFHFALLKSLHQQFVGRCVLDESLFKR